jgi:hypothetical protein
VATYGAVKVYVQMRVYVHPEEVDVFRSSADQEKLLVSIPNSMHAGPNQAG